MRGIQRKAMADLRSRPLQTVLLFVVIALAAATLTIALAIREQASRPYDRLMDRTNGAHVWMYADDRESLEAVASRPDVLAAAGPFARTRGESDIETGRASVVSLWGMSSEPPAVARPLIETGRWLEQPGELVLEAGLARISGLKLGESITITTGASERTFEIVGTALTSSRLPYPQYQPGVGYALEQDVFDLAGGFPEWEVGLRLSDPEATSAFLQSAFEGAEGGTSAITWQSMRDHAAENSEVQGILFAVFGAFAVGAVALIVANSVSAALLAQYREIGILKSIGFTPMQVAGVFVGSQVLLALIASAAGSVLGFVVAPWLLGDVASVLNAPRTPAFLPVVFAGVVIVIVTLVTLVAWLPAWAGGRATPVRTIAGPNAMGSGISRLSVLAGALKLPTPLRVGLKDAFARPIRSWFTVGALALAVATGAIALSVTATLDAGIEDPSLFSGELYDLEIVSIPPGGLEAAAAVVAAHPDIEQSTVEYRLLIEATATERSTMIRAIVDPGFGPYLTEGRSPESAGEVLLTTSLANRWGLSVGDTYTREVAYFPAAGETRPVGTRTFTVTGLYNDGDDDGATILTTVATFPVTPDIAIAATIGMKLRDVGESARVAFELEALLGDGHDVYDEATVTRNDLQEVIDGATPILSGLTAVLLLIALVNVLTTLLFSVRERYQEIGVLKSIGFTPAQVVSSIAMSACLLGLAGVAIGIPLGLTVSEMVFNHFGAEAGWKPGVAVVPSGAALAALLPIGLVVAVAGAYIPARRAAGMSPTEALRFE